MKPVYTIEVGAKVEQARTSSALGIGVGRMQLEDRAKGGRLRAMASAQVYFARPQSGNEGTCCETASMAFAAGDGQRSGLFCPAAAFASIPAYDLGAHRSFIRAREHVQPLLAGSSGGNARQ